MREICVTRQHSDIDFANMIFNILQERLWRRTRSTNPNDPCRGVDGNRNFDIAFNTVGVNSDPCSLTYPGVTPFSEVETVYIRDILHENLDRIQLYMNIHSHGNWILYGYGFNGTLPPNAAQVSHNKRNTHIYNIIEIYSWPLTGKNCSNVSF